MLGALQASAGLPHACCSIRHALQATLLLTCSHSSTVSSAALIAKWQGLLVSDAHAHGSDAAPAAEASQPAAGTPAAPQPSISTEQLRQLLQDAIHGAEQARPLHTSASHPSLAACHATARSTSMPTHTAYTHACTTARTRSTAARTPQPPRMRTHSRLQCSKARAHQRWCRTPPVRCSCVHTAAWARPHSTRRACSGCWRTSLACSVSG
jgi:hypothetical protein